VIKSDGAGLGEWATRVGGLASSPMKVCSDVKNEEKVKSMPYPCLSERTHVEKKYISCITVSCQRTIHPELAKLH